MIDEGLRNKTIQILEDEQNQLDGCFDSQSDIVAPKKLEKTSITQNSDGSWNKVVFEENSNLTDGSIDSVKRKEVIDKAEILQQFCKTIDDKILSINAEINIKKEQIVSLSTEATNGNCWPGIAYSTVGSISGGGKIDSLFTFYSAETTVNNEVERIRIYPNMAGPDVRFDVDNPFEPDTVYNLSPKYSGYGYKNLVDPIFYKNKDGTFTGLRTDGSGSLIGDGRFDISKTESDHNARVIISFPFFRYYFGTNSPTTPARCVEIANQIDSIYNEIIVLRKERDALRDDLSVIKNNKSEKELSSWGINRIYRSVADRKTINSSALLSIQKLSPDISVPVSELIVNLDVSDPDSYSGIGTNWFDLSGIGNNAVLYPISSPASYEYVDKGILKFNGIDQYAQTGIRTSSQSNVLGSGTNWMIETWFKINGAPSNIFNSLVSIAGTIQPSSGIITGITTTGISVGQYVYPIPGIIGSGTTVTAIGIGSVYIKPRSVNVSVETTNFQFGKYEEYANTIVDVNASSTTTNMLGVSRGQSGIFSGISTNRLIYTVSSGAASTTLVGSAITSGLWYHGVVVRNGTTNTKLYLNGVNVATYNGDLTLGTGSTTTTKIAAWTDENIFSNVSISVVKIYQKSYTDDEVKNKFDASKGRYELIG